YSPLRPSMPTVATGGAAGASSQFGLSAPPVLPVEPRMARAAPMAPPVRRSRPASSRLLHRECAVGEDQTPHPCDPVVSAVRTAKMHEQVQSGGGLPRECVSWQPREHSEGFQTSGHIREPVRMYRARTALVSGVQGGE